MNLCEHGNSDGTSNGEEGSTHLGTSAGLREVDGRVGGNDRDGGVGGRNDDTGGVSRRRAGLVAGADGNDNGGNLRGRDLSGWDLRDVSRGGARGGAVGVAGGDNWDGSLRGDRDVGGLGLAGADRDLRRARGDGNDVSRVDRRVRLGRGNDNGGESSNSGGDGELHFDGLGGD